MNFWFFSTLTILLASTAFYHVDQVLDELDDLVNGEDDEQELNDQNLDDEHGFSEIPVSSHCGAKISKQKQKGITICEYRVTEEGESTITRKPLGLKGKYAPNTNQIKKQQNLQEKILESQTRQRSAGSRNKSYKQTSTKNFYQNQGNQKLGKKNNSSNTHSTGKKDKMQKSIKDKHKSDKKNTGKKY